MLTNLTEIPVDDLLRSVAARKPLGYRFVTVTCTDLGDAHELTYHFDKDYVLEHLRLRLPRGQVLPSVSRIYRAAAIVENEIQDLFGVRFEGLAIDYEGRFLLTAEAPRAPLNKQSNPEPKPEPDAGGTP